MAFSTVTTYTCVSRYYYLLQYNNIDSYELSTAASY